MLDNLPGVLPGELLVFLVALGCLLDLGDFVPGKAAALLHAVFPEVEVVARALWAMADDRERAMLHALDLEGLFMPLAASARHCPGVVPNFALNLALKVLKWLNPHSIATSMILELEFRRSAMARSNITSSFNWKMEHPKCLLTTRSRCRRLQPHRWATSSRDKS